MKLVTEKLQLRPITEEDANDVFLIRSNSEINRFVKRIPPKNSLEALDFILKIKKNTENKESVYWGISQQNKRKLIGTICLWKFSEDQKKAELGYELLPEFHGKGIMSEAVNSVLNFGFNELNLEKIEAFTNKNNVNSIKLLQKFNFILNENREDIGFPDNLVFELPIYQLKQPI